MDTKHDIPHREIGEQDDELLEQLWKQLPDSQEDPFIADQGFKDLQGRIQRKLRIKRRFRILTAGSIAAALITGVLISVGTGFYCHCAVTGYGGHYI